MAIGSPQWMYASGEAYELEQSLRYEDGKSPSLEWTPSSNGNRKTWTYSTWFKRGNVNSSATRGMLLSAYENSSNYTYIGFDDGGGGYDRIRVYSLESSIPKIDFESTAQFRDVSGWYHLVVSVDTTQGTSSNRVKIYVNGEQITDWAASTEPSQNYDTVVSKTIRHNIGSYVQSSSFYDGYLAEVNFIDGQALTPADFGETGDYGEWKPIEYSGTYGTNGFYLPFKQDYTVEGFSTVTWKGTGSEQYIGGTGFQPDLTWIKNRGAGYSHVLANALSGSNKFLSSNGTGAESTDSTKFQTFETDGFNVGTHAGVNSSSNTYVAWNWDMGGSNATNTDGSITSTVRANPTYGQSIVSYTGTGSATTVGHGLDSAPEMVVVKSRDAAENWVVFHTGINSGQGYIKLNLSDAATTGSSRRLRFGNDSDGVVPDSTKVYIGSGSEVNTSGNDYIAYCFHSVTGYSKFGNYTGNGSATGPSVTTNFPVGWIMIKNSSSTGNWRIYDNTRDPSNPNNRILYANESEVDQETAHPVDLLSDGFQIKGTNADINTNGNTYIYMAFADKREYAYWLDQSGNNNDWTSNNLTESDISVDSPSNNFATLNPLDSRSTVLAEGNLQNTPSGSNHWGTARSTFAMPSGSWYAEFYCKAGTGNGNNFAGIATQSEPLTGISDSSTPLGFSSTSWGYSDNDNIYNNGSIINSTGTTWVTGDIIGVTFTGTVLKFYKNNSLIATVSNIPVNDYCFTTNSWTTSMSMIANFGQDSSFAGNKVAQGNQDSNDIGDFYYTPPTGFLALCTKNLPDVTVVPSEHFDVVTYTGTGSGQAVAVNFQPDFSWIKVRSITDSAVISDAVRGATKVLFTAFTNAEVDNSAFVSAFTSTGLTLGGNRGTSQSGETYVAWNWKANGSGSSNTNGSVTSTVSANVDAGFSIATWTGTSGLGTDTIGHGLSQAPELIISKISNTGDGWYVYHKDLASGSGLQLNTTAAVASSYWASAPTSTVFTEPNDSTNVWEHVTYCFHSVDGYSKVGSYTGNGSTDGTFVYTGFRPAYVMVKRTDANGNSWSIKDTERFPNNVMNGYLFADSSSAEGTASSLDIDFTSNGFKWRGTSSDGNQDGGTYIYLCFAETPFKYSNAR